MRHLPLLLCVVLAGCERASDVFDSVKDGYVVKCVEGTRYVAIVTDTGVAIAPLLGTDGLPKGCKE